MSRKVINFKTVINFLMNDEMMKSATWVGEFNSLIQKYNKNPNKKFMLNYVYAKNKRLYKLTRFIVFMPMFLAFGLTVLSWFVFSRPIVINVSFITDWISATAISLAIYAVIEKMFPKKSKVMSDKNKLLIKEKITEVSDELKNGEFDDANSTENCAKLLNMILPENEKSENDN